ncbi:hypothetical protein B296_00003392 [Ensete ventricosum]|uniref:Uncharacterized protein n=1 Tax=Ensete ventricosum TaxID=4639 RepID=A0A427AS48_ENSVE|nr:hypothetical protein B296_00003392 [Ensete ventricosum]
MGWGSRNCLIVAASMSAVEAPRDQAGLRRWNYVLRPRQKRAKDDMKPMPSSQSTMSSSTIGESTGVEGGDERGKQSEESLRLVMYLSCWGPN